MTPKLLLYLLLVIFCCTPLKAQQKNCLPAPIAAASTELNIFSEEQEIILGDAMAERMQKDYAVIEDKALIA